MRIYSVNWKDKSSVFLLPNKNQNLSLNKIKIQIIKELLMFNYLITNKDYIFKFFKK